MIRILFTIVAVVAAILGVVLPMPELFVAAGLALLATLGLVISRAQRRRTSHKAPAVAYAPRENEDDLSSLGILEIRPREKGASGGSGAAKQPAGEARLDHAPSEIDEQRGADAGRTTDSTRPRERAGSAVPGDGAVDDVQVESERRPSRPAADSETDLNGAGQPSIVIKEKTQTIRADVDERVPGHYRDVIVPYLQSFRAAVQAHTVCLLKQPIDGLHHHIEGIVSLNAYARSGGDFATKVPLLQTRDSRSAVDVRRVSDEDFPASGLGYYREAIAVKELAVVPVPGEAAAGQYVLLADSMQERTFDSDRSRSLMGHFARLLGAVMDDARGGEVLESYDYVRPRKEIIQEEIERARAAQRPLALALVHLNRAESVADLGEREVKNSEGALAAYLRKTARNARVERFGELTFGVFFNAVGARVEKWATEVQQDLEHTSGSLEGGVSIGIAVLQDRHADADALRRDATDALREAYESGTCTIVE